MSDGVPPHGGLSPHDRIDGVKTGWTLGGSPSMRPLPGNQFIRNQKINSSTRAGEENGRRCRRDESQPYHGGVTYEVSCRAAGGG